MRITKNQLRKIIREELFYTPAPGSPQPAPIAVGLYRNLRSYLEENPIKSAEDTARIRKTLPMRAYAMAPKGNFDAAWIEEFKHQLSGRIQHLMMTNPKLPGIPLDRYTRNMCVRRAVEKISGAAPGSLGDD